MMKKNDDDNKENKNGVKSYKTEIKKNKYDQSYYSWNIISSYSK